MKKWVDITLNIKYFILAFLSFSCFLFLQVNQANEDSVSIEKFQEVFLQQEKKLKKSAVSALHAYHTQGEIPVNEHFNVHIYQQDRLVKWNTNQMPVSNFTTIQFPNNGVFKLQNGWYYGAVYKKGKYSCSASFSILSEYAYSNEFISSKPNSIFGLIPFRISLDANQGFPIYSLSKHYCFSIIPIHDNQGTNSWVILPLILIGLISLLYACYELVEKQKRWRWIFVLSLLCVRILLFEVPLESLFEQAGFMDANLFAYNEWFPRFFDFCINSVFIAFGLMTLFKSFKENQHPSSKWIQYLGVLGTWWVIISLIKMLLLHSSIPLNFSHFFDLNSLSFVFLALIGLLFLSFQIIAFGMISVFQERPRQLLIALVISAAFFVVYWSISGQTGFSLITWLFPIFIVLLHLFFGKRINSLQKFSFQLLLLCSFSFIFVHELIQKNEQKDLENRAIYTMNLAAERDVNLELEYLELKEKLTQDRLFRQFADSSKTTINSHLLSNILEKRYFHGLWDGYELYFDIFDSQERPCFSTGQYTFKQLKVLISKHGQKSDIDGSIYFMPDEENGLTYIILEKIQQGAQRLTLSVRLKSKRIPEEIGFPRLLISDKANVMNSLEKYSIAKYSEGQLIHQSGAYNFPVSIHALLGNRAKEGSFQLEGFNHYFYRKSSEYAIVISVKSKSWFDYITSLAYIFCFWGILLIVIYLVNGKAVLRGIDLSFAFKIQIAFVMVIVLSLLLYGIGSGVFVGKQYESFTRRSIEEKLNSIQEELKSKLANNDDLVISRDRDRLQNSLQKIASVFKTDVNIYNSKGLLVASSRSKIFDLGLISEQMNPKAMHKLIDKHSSSFSHTEEIGQLAYISSYLPVFNEDHQEIGFINLQHFGQQQEYENQIETFVTSIINVFILLLALSVIIGLLVSNWLIEPLVVLKKHMSSIQFGKENKHIKYQQKDEIGAIVQAYNDKLDELKIAAQHLASTEREMAWREMAQQIAHEIKNPLTPMKLSIQHLLRSYDPKNKEGEQQLNRVLDSIIEQIDGLTRMANEFSNFAKMPEPILQRENMVDIVGKVVSLYENEDQIKLEFHPESRAIMVNVDRNLWIQVLVNLLQNAQQALAGIPNGKIHIQVTAENHYCLIQVSDNGCGISSEESFRIFTPHFTTKSSGSGIGLSLVKQIIEKHGGMISFESKENEGTTFRMELPMID